jgi:hypothetical protein
VVGLPIIGVMALAGWVAAGDAVTETVTESDHIVQYRILECGPTTLPLSVPVGRDPTDKTQSPIPRREILM